MRCVIYARKSHGERADPQLSSIELQRERCETYIASQEGWTVVDLRYDDVGFSGGTVDRPGLRALLAAVEAGELDMVVIYKIDRFSRSLRDFLNLVSVLDRKGVGLVSTTQSFSTSTSLGRLTLNILLSFAQFERDLIGERSKDWKAGARARGLWTSGPPPFGYIVRDLRLEPDSNRAELLREVFVSFVRRETFAVIARRLNDAGYRNRLNRPFSGAAVRAMIESRTYRGEMPHAGGYGPGIHEPLISEELWQEAQRVLSARRVGLPPHQRPLPG